MDASTKKISPLAKTTENKQLWRNIESISNDSVLTDFKIQFSHKCEVKPLPFNSWLENLEILPLPFHAQNRLCLIQNIKLRMYSQIKRMYVLTHDSILV